MPCDGAAPSAEKESCRSCPNRMRCHGKKTEVTQETILRLIREVTVEVLQEHEAKRRGAR